MTQAAQPDVLDSAISKSLAPAVPGPSGTSDVLDAAIGKSLGIPSDVVARHARSQAGQSINPGTPNDPGIAENLVTGAAKGVGDTVQGAARLVGGKDAVSGGVLGDTDTSATGIAQHIGKAGESVLEFMLGDSALEGLSMGDKLAKIAPTIKAIEAHPALARVIGAAVRGAVVGGTEGGLKAGAAGDVRAGIEQGATMGAASGAVAEAVPAVYGAAKSFLGNMRQGADASLAPAESALRVNPWASARTANQSLRTLMDTPVTKVGAAREASYNLLDKTAGTDVKALYERLENTEYNIRQLTGTEEDVQKEAALEKGRTAIMDKIAAARQDVTNRLGQNGTDLFDKSDQLFKKEQALKDLQTKVFKNTNVVIGNSASGTAESVNVDAAVKALQKMQDDTKFGAPRLEQALGKDGAKTMLDSMYAAQRAGVKAVSRQAMMKTIGTYVKYAVEGAGAATGAKLGYDALTRPKP